MLLGYLSVAFRLADSRPAHEKLTNPFCLRIADEILILGGAVRQMMQLLLLSSLAPSCRYSEVSIQTRVAAILSPEGFVDSTQDSPGPHGLVLESTPFYAEQGGQVADTGSIASTSGSCFRVQDAQVGLAYRVADKHSLRSPRTECGTVRAACC